ncbi:MAG: T9SS type A sorting domain-containing protein [Saprospiraceae bacterium]|nr:T9SS type A sorting domain-containing protein [Saprospiraceae bacterium]
MIKYLYLLLLATSILLTSSSTIEGPGNYFCANATNAPGDGTCMNCHVEGNLFEGDIQIGIEGDPIFIEPSTTYDMYVTINNTSENAMSTGFQIIALEQDGNTNSNVGTWIAGTENEIFDTGNPLNTTSCNNSGRIYIENILPQSLVNNSKTWNFQWTSPEQASGTINFYAGGLLTNGSGLEGDSYFSNDIIDIPFSSPVSSSSPAQSLVVETYPNPVVSKLNIKSELEVKYELTDQLGRLIMTGKIIGAVETLHMGHMEKGVYILTLTNPSGETISKKILKL